MSEKPKRSAEEMQQLAELPPPKHDGWKSRKVILGIGFFLSGWGPMTTQLIRGELSGEVYASFMMGFVPLCLGIITGMLTLEKVGLANRLRG